MDLDAPPAHGGSGRRRPEPPSLLDVYILLVCVLGVVGLAVALGLGDWPSMLSDRLLLPIIFLGVCAVVGELRPVPITRGDAPMESISTSESFVLALVAVGGVGVAVLVQTVATLADDLLHRRSFVKSAFNTCQYVLSVLAARAVFSLFAGVPFFGGPMALDASQLLPLLAAGVTMVLVNRVLVAVVVRLVADLPLLAVLREDAGTLVATHAVLLSIGGVAADVADDGLAALALLVPPVVAVYLTASASIRHAHQATHDSLTGLGNRYRLYARLTDGLQAAAAEEPGTGTGLVLLDLDHFRDINDTLGHPVGDQLLREVGERLVHAVGGDGVVHRLGGDEFAVIVVGDRARCERVARVLLDALQAPMEVGGVELLVRASAGVAVGPEHGRDAHELMKNADVALYRAKRERDKVSTYDRLFDVNSLDRLQVLADLRSALDSGRLSVAFQPQVDLAGGRVVGVEALVRWDHPTRGMVPPDQFIPLAENSGLIADVTHYVLAASLRTLAGWRAAGHDVRMAVNLSARHLSDPALPGQVSAALSRHGVPAPALVLEVTETGILADPVRADQILGALRRLGVGIAVDDYGTGHASLSYLKRLEIDELKIDKSFVSDMGRDHNDFVIVRSTIALAGDLGLRVIAEGIEDEDTAVALRRLGCDIGQGYHLDRPTTAEAVLRRLDQERDAAALGPRG